MARPGFPRQRAVTLIEAVLFISVALGLIVGGIVFFQQASLNARISAQVRVLSSIVAESRALMNNQDADTRLGAAGDVLVAAGSVPARIIADPPIQWNPGNPADVTRLKTEWDTGLVISNSWAAVGFGVGSAYEYYLTLTLHDIPVEACVRLAPTDASGKTVFGDGALRVGIGPGQSVGGIGTPFPGLSPSDAAAGCAAGAAGGATTDLEFLMKFST